MAQSSLLFMNIRPEFMDKQFTEVEKELLLKQVSPPLFT
jgi:hypothetical protein